MYGEAEKNSSHGDEVYPCGYPNASRTEDGDMTGVLKGLLADEDDDDEGYVDGWGPMLRAIPL